MTKQLSSCCKAPVEVINEDEGTCFWICSKCKKPCDLYVKLTKNQEYIYEHTTFIEPNQLRKVYITDTFQIACEWEDFDTNGKNKMIWQGEIQKIYLDENGEANGYDVYVY